MKSFTATIHSVRRHGKRFNMHGYNRNARQLEVDLRSGRRTEDFSGMERVWLMMREKPGYTVYVSNGKCMIVSETGNIVTVYALPEWFRVGTPRYCGKDVIRNPRHYVRCHREYDSKYC